MGLLKQARETARIEASYHDVAKALHTWKIIVAERSPQKRVGSPAVRPLSFPGVAWGRSHRDYCWKYPESGLRFFHTYEGGFKSRMPIQ